jgi:hypothetical protein
MGVMHRKFTIDTVGVQLKPLGLGKEFNWNSCISLENKLTR